MNNNFLILRNKRSRYMDLISPYTWLKGVLVIFGVLCISVCIMYNNTPRREGGMNDGKKMRGCVLSSECLQPSTWAMIDLGPTFLWQPTCDSKPHAHKNTTPPHYYYYSYIFFILFNHTFLKKSFKSLLFLSLLCKQRCNYNY